MYGPIDFTLSRLRPLALAAAIGLGTAIGCVMGGYLSRGRINANVVTAGAVGTVAMLLLNVVEAAEHGLGARPRG